MTAYRVPDRQAFVLAVRSLPSPFAMPPLEVMQHRILGALFRLTGSGPAPKYTTTLVLVVETIGLCKEERPLFDAALAALMLGGFAQTLEVPHSPHETTTAYMLVPAVPAAR